MPGGRPSIFSEELADLICSRLAEGDSLRAICRDEAMPSVGTVCRWLNENAKFQEQYTSAREIQAETFADELVLIADTPLIGTKTKTVGDKIETIEGDMIEHRRLQVDTRKWVAARLLPKKYGDKLALGGSKEMDPIKTEDVSDNELARRVAFMLSKGIRSDGA
jgi:hypothetical protein